MVVLARFLALASGLTFGAGLAISGMIDPARVRAFLDIAGSWDPRLAFVMVGAMLPMGVAWRVVRRLERPLAASRFYAPTWTHIDRSLVIGAALFGVGWGLAGLCPGPAIASLATRPWDVAPFLVAMVAGMAVHSAWARGAPRQPAPTVSLKRSIS